MAKKTEPEYKTSHEIVKLSFMKTKKENKQTTLCQTHKIYLHRSKKILKHTYLSGLPVLIAK
jgi:hypothetical protein